MSKTTSADYVAMAFLVIGGLAIVMGGEHARKQWLSSPFMQPVAPAAVGPSAAAADSNAVIHLIQERPQTPPAATNQVTTVSPEALNRVFQIPAAAAGAQPAADGAAPAVDYWERLRGRSSELLRLGAVAHNGAVINGKFRALKEDLVELEYPGGQGGKNVSPRLAALSDKTATVLEPVAPYRRIILRLEDSSR